MAGNRRLLIAVGLIVVMVVALVVLLLSSGDEPLAETSTTTPTVPTTSSTPTTSAPATTVATTTTSSVADPDARLAEVEQILEDLELARLIAIYNKDQSALAGIIATQAGIDGAMNAFSTLSFAEDPKEVGIEIRVIEVLLDRPDCLVVHHEFDGRQALGASATETAVRILWPRADGNDDYRLARLWSSPGDLWQDDCDLMDRDEVP